MEIKGKVHCMFEQSGTFKNEFKKLGYEAYDYDIQNNFGETDYVIDLFHEIEQAYDNKPSIFDNIIPDDLIVAFFPCIYFTGSTNPCYFTLENNNYKSLSLREKLEKILDRAKNREYFYELLYKMIGVCLLKDFRIIFENPYTTQHYLCNNFLKPPSVIDTNRLLRGDYFKKPTGYWFFNCEPTYGESFQNDKKQKIVWEMRGQKLAGLCSEERSLISPDYARNWICDFVLGKKQDIGQLQLF
jgi:hypothetical protein